MKTKKPKPAQPARKPLTIKQLRETPTVDLGGAAQVLGIGRTLAYEMAICSTKPELARRRGVTEPFPCKIVLIGNQYRVPTPALLKLLGADED